MKINKFFSDIYIDTVLYVCFLTYILLNFNNTKLDVLVFLLVMIFLLFWIVSRIQLGNAFSVLPSASRLVTSGIYSKIRHPIYLFTFIANVGIIYLLGNRWFYYLIPVMFTLQYYRAKKEEAILSEHFGQAFENYRKKTWF